MSLAGETTCAFALYSAAATCISFAAYVLWQLGSYNGIQFKRLLEAAGVAVMMP